MMAITLLCRAWQTPSLSWPPVYDRTAACVKGYGLAVDAARGLVIVSGYDDMQLYVYSLVDGSLLRRFGGKGSGKGQFHWYWGGVCTTPTGNLLVAERYNDRLQEVTIEDGSWVRFLGEGLLDKPNRVACSESVIAVSETMLHRVVLLSWADGSLLGRFGSEGGGDGQLTYPCGLRLLADGSGVVIADHSNYRLCVVSLTGAFVRSIPAGRQPRDVVECDGGASFIVANYGPNTLSKVSAATGAVVPFGTNGSGDGELTTPTALALVLDSESGGGSGGRGSGGQLVVLEADNSRFQVFRV